MAYCRLACIRVVSISVPVQVLDDASDDIFIFIGHLHYASEGLLTRGQYWPSIRKRSQAHHEASVASIIEEVASCDNELVNVELRASVAFDD